MASEVHCIDCLRFIEEGGLPEEYVVFDPFSGSGTTGIACARLGRDFIGCEIVPEFAELSERRIEEAVKERDEAERY